jgi:type IV pilus assembly protein PilC
MAAAARNRLSFEDLFAILMEDPELLSADAPMASLMHEALGDGKSLSEAMARLPDLFEGPTIALVKYGEAHEQLADILEILGSEQSDLAQSDSAVRTALAWPKTMLFFLLSIVSALMIFVVPSFKQVFSSFGGELPAPTLFVIEVSELFVNYWFWIVAIVAILYVARRRNMIPVFWRLQIERLILSSPAVRNYVMRVFGVQLMRWFARFHTSPELIGLALLHVQATSKWLVVRGLAAEMALRLAAGKSFGQALDHLPPLPRRLGLQVRLGEKTGNISGAVAQALDVAEIELAHALTRFERGVLLSAYLTIGLLVGFVVIAMYLPIFKLGQVV